MKINKKIFVCALLVLMLLCCVNAASAEETFNETLGADVADDLAIDATPDEALNAGGDTLSVDENIGDYKTASDADASGAGDEVLSASDADPELAAGNTIYVSTAGSDSNDGLSEANAVATINHAVDIADGKIVILAGEYTVTSILNINKDLEITGQGDVTIKSNSKYSVDVWDDYWEEWDTETHYMLINNSANLKLDNIKFTLVPASVSDQLINNLGNLYMTDCEFSNIKITSGRGVIQNAKGGYAEVKDTTFQTASSTYGAINNNGELLVDGCKFLDNDRSSDSGVYSTAITSYNKATILNSEFKNNKGTAGGAVYVMYSYTLKENPVMDIKNCTFDNNVAPGTSYTSGTGGAVKCNGKAITLNIEDSTFTNNNAKNGGAVYAEGNVTIINSVFHDNTASIGEDVYVASGSNTAVLGCTVDDESYLWEADGGNLTIGDAPAKPVKANITVSAGTVLAGNDATVTVSVPNATGTVTIEINGKSYDVELDNGVATKDIPAADLVAGENVVTATYNGPDFESNDNITSIYVLDGVVTNETFFNYFNASNSNRLCDYIPEGATLDFQGKFIGSSSVSYIMEINKPINIISTTKDAYVDLDTVAQGMTGENPGNRFTVSSGGSGSNISDIYFHNSQIWITGAHNLNIDNFTSYVENQKIGSGVGVVAIRGGSSHIKFKNSYFYTKDNGGSSTFVLTNASYISVDSSSIIGEGNVGNLIYMNVYNMDLPDGVYLPQILTMLKNGELELNDHNNFTNCYIKGPEESSGICILVQNMGSGHNIFENNTFVYGGTDLNVGNYGIAKNNTLVGGCGLSTGENSVISDNIMEGELSVGANALVYNNTAGKLKVSGKDAYISDNVINGTVTIATKATNTTFVKNNVSDTVTVNSKNNTIVENKVIVSGDYAIDLKKNTGNTVTDNYLVAKKFHGNKAVSYSNSNNVVENNLPLAEIIITADPVWIGSNGVVSVNVPNATGTVTIEVNGKSYDVELDENGTGY